MGAGLNSPRPIQASILSIPKYGSALRMRNPPKAGVQWNALSSLLITHVDLRGYLLGHHLRLQDGHELPRVTTTIDLAQLLCRPNTCPTARQGAKSIRLATSESSVAIWSDSRSASSLTTGLRNLPMLVTSTSTRSPSFM